MNVSRAIAISKAKSFSRATRFSGVGLPALLLLAGLGGLRAQSTWSVNTGSWATAGNWTPAGVPISDFATQLLFNDSGATNYTSTNNIGAFNLNRITVNNTGTGTVTITGPAANTLTMGGADPTLDITGKVLFLGLLAGSATITKTGTGTFIHDSNNTNFTGTVIINQGTFVNRSTTVATTNFNPVSIVVNSGGTYQFGENTTGNPNLPNSTYVTINPGGMVSWQEGEDFGGFHLQGGTLNLQAGGANAVGTTAQSWTSGTLTGTGTGTFAVAGSTPINKTTTGTVIISGNASLTTTGGLNIIEGTVSMLTPGNLGTSNVNLGDGGGATAGTFDYQGGTATRGGGFSINAGNGFINIASPTTVLTLTGLFAGPGNLGKTGPGKLHLAGALVGSGTTTVSEGTLQIDPSTAFGAFAVASSAVLAVNSGAGAFTFTAPSINLLAGTSTLQFDLDTSALPTSPLLVIGTPDGLTFTGTPTLRLTNLQPFANGTYTLVDYDGTGIASGFDLALPGRTLGTLIYDTVNTRIDLTIAGTDTLRWAGQVNGDWEASATANVGGTNNWKLVTAGAATNFIDTDSITFDDTATARVLNLTTVVQPASVAVNATGDYTFDGVGKLSGATALNKSGAGKLILGTDNDYSGGTNINGGTVQLGNGGTTGSVVGIVSLNGGNLAFNHSDNYTFSNTVALAGSAGLIQNGAGTVTMAAPLATGANLVTLGGPGNLTMAATVSGTGVLTKEGAGTLTLLANNNTFTGTFLVNGGTVLLNDLGAGGDLGATSIVVNDGGTFIFGPAGNVDFPDTTVVTVNTGGLFRIEQGENFGGYILDGGEFRYVSTANTGVNSVGVTLIAGTTVYDLRSGTINAALTAPGTGAAMNQTGGGVLTKTTNGTVTIGPGVTFQTTLALQIKEGTLAMNAPTVPATGAAPITLGSPLTSGTLQINGAGSAVISRPVTLDGGNGNGGTFNIVEAGTSLIIASNVTGPGSLFKTGQGSLLLSAVNDYAGGTLVATGTLEVNNFTGSATGSGPVVVNGTLTGDGGVITGPGGSDVEINGLFLPGFTGAVQGTDFIIATGAGSKTVFGATSVARFDLWSTTGTDQSGNPLAADLLLLIGDLKINSGATLKLSNPNTLAFQEGDVFTLFNWTGLGTLSGAWNIDASDLALSGLTVDTSNLYSSGTIAIAAVPEPGSAVLALLGMSAFVVRRRRGGC